jgi:pyridoxine 4-dehydrogenase
VPWLGIGTISWGLRGFGGITDWIEKTALLRAGGVNSAETVLLASLLKGIDFLDTAERYGNSFSTAVGLGYGETEQFIGRTLKQIGVRGIVATKFTPTPGRSTVDSVVAACEASRRRLGVETIDLYQIQMPDIVQPWARVPFAPKEWSTPKDEIYWEGLAECYRRGIVANVGVSNYGPTLLRRAHAFLKSRGVPLASNQINYSLLYRNSGAQATVDACKELGVAVLAYFPLAMGVLTGKWKSKDLLDIGPLGEPTNPVELTGKSSLEQIEIAELAKRAGPLLKELETIAAARGKEVSQVALNWIICKGAIPIPGARTVQQASQNSGALGWRLSPGEVRRLEDAADQADCEFEGAGFKRSNSKFVGYGYEVWNLD